MKCMKLVIPLQKCLIILVSTVNVGRPVIDIVADVDEVLEVEGFDKFI